MRRGGLIVAFGAVLAAAPAQAGEQEITAAYHAGDRQRLEVLRADLHPASYWSAYLDWRLGSLLLGGDAIEEADAVLLRAEEKLTHLTAAEPPSAEVWALLSVTTGMRIGISPGARGMKMGPASGRAGKRALSLEPENPRALLVVGINKFNTPALFGGGKKRALKYLNKSLASWQENGAGVYGWGEADIYLWRGRAHGALGDEQSACADYAAALAVAPQFEWAAQLRDRLGCAGRR